MKATESRTRTVTTKKGDEDGKFIVVLTFDE
jgi:hypothetical protein